VAVIELATKQTVQEWPPGRDIAPKDGVPTADIIWRL